MFFAENQRLHKIQYQFKYYQSFKSTRIDFLLNQSNVPSSKISKFYLKNFFLATVFFLWKEMFGVCLGKINDSHLIQTYTMITQGTPTHSKSPFQVKISKFTNVSSTIWLFKDIPGPSRDARLDGHTYLI